MTTRVHIVNFGPNAVEVSVPAYSGAPIPSYIYAQDSKNFTVYDGQDIIVKEVTQPKLPEPAK
jgi:hypothetical protein